MARHEFDRSMPSVPISARHFASWARILPLPIPDYCLGFCQMVAGQPERIPGFDCLFDQCDHRVGAGRSCSVYDFGHEPSWRACTMSALTMDFNPFDG